MYLESISTINGCIHNSCFLAKRWHVSYFLRKLDGLVGLPVINRALMKGIHYLISEDQVAFYFSCLRTSFWPNGQLAPNSPVRSHHQKEATKRRLYAAVKSQVSLCKFESMSF